jgi:hypothetical protein
MRNNKQQTPLEWFIEELEYKGDLRETPSIRNIQLNIDTSDYMELKVQAKEMERQRIENAFNSGYNNGGLDTCLTPKQYYNETYGGGEQ